MLIGKKREGIISARPGRDVHGGPEGSGGKEPALG